MERNKYTYEAYRTPNSYDQKRTCLHHNVAIIPEVYHGDKILTARESQHICGNPQRTPSKLRGSG